MGCSDTVQEADHKIKGRFLCVFVVASYRRALVNPISGEFYV